MDPKEKSRIFEIQRDILGERVIEPYVTHLLIACERIACWEIENAAKDATIAELKQELKDASFESHVKANATIAELRALLRELESRGFLECIIYPPCGDCTVCRAAKALEEKK